MAITFFLLFFPFESLARLSFLLSFLLQSSPSLFLFPFFFRFSLFAETLELGTPLLLFLLLDGCDGSSSGSSSLSSSSAAQALTAAKQAAADGGKEWMMVVVVVA